MSGFSKGDGAKDTSYATGGASLGRTKDFLKTPDRFRDSQFKKAPETDETWDKGSSEANPAAKDKSLPTVKPRK